MISLIWQFYYLIATEQNNSLICNLIVFITVRLLFNVPQFALLYFQAERRFEQAQIDRRAHQQQTTALHVKLKEIHAALDKVQRGEERYLALLTEEYEVLRQEKQVALALVDAERTERDSFAALSSAVRESHERERARAERTKYWSIIGSVIGATIGIVGTTINNYRRMRELKALVHDSATGGAELSRSVYELVGATKNQQDELQTVLSLLRPASEAPAVTTTTANTTTIPPSESSIPSDLRELIMTNKRALELHMGDIKRMLAAASAHSADEQTPNVVYVGPEIKDLLAQTESNIACSVERNAIASSVVLYAAGVITAVAIYAILAGRI